MLVLLFIAFTITIVSISLLLSNPYKRVPKFTDNPKPPVVNLHDQRIYTLVNLHDQRIYTLTIGGNVNVRDAKTGLALGTIYTSYNRTQMVRVIESGKLDFHINH